MRASLIAVAACVLVLASPALAQYELPGGTYSGTTNQARGDVRFTLTSTERRITRFVFEWRAYKCGDRRNRARGRTTARNIRVANRRFSKRGSRTRRLPATETFGGGTEVERYRVAGRLLSDNRASGTISVTVTLRNRFGTILDTCRMGGTARWRASKLGVTNP